MLKLRVCSRDPQGQRLGKIPFGLFIRDARLAPSDPWGDGSELAHGTTDAVGYGSVTLDSQAEMFQARLAFALKKGLDDGSYDVVVRATGTKTPGVGLLSELGALGNLAQINALREGQQLPPASSVEAVKWLIAKFFSERHVFHVTATLDQAVPGSCATRIDDPDEIDYQLSPSSFVESSPKILGADGCEHIVPSTLPIQTYQFHRLNLRHDLTTVPNTGYSVILGNPPMAQVAGDLLSDRRLILAEAYVFEQTWASLGHSLGEIQYSLALAPGEAMKIAVIDWARQDDIRRADTARTKEKLLHSQTLNRDIDEIVSGNVQEQQGGISAMVGGASSTNSAGAGSASSQADRVVAGIGGSFTAGNRDMRAESQQDIHTTVVQNTNVVRSLNSTVVIQAGQSEQNYLATRIVANMNRMHALTIQYYEVLRHLRVTTRFKRRDWALLVPFETFAFTDDMLRRFRQQLEPVLLDPRRAAGFDALERLKIGESAYLASNNTGSNTSGSINVNTSQSAIQVSSYKLSIESGPGQQRDTWGEVSIEFGNQLLFSKPTGGFKGLDGVKNETNVTKFETTISDGPSVEIAISVPNVSITYKPLGLDANLDGWDINRLTLSALVQGQWELLLDWHPARIEVPAKGLDTSWKQVFVRPVDIRNKWDATSGADMLRSANALLVLQTHLPSVLTQFEANQVADNYITYGASLTTPITWRPASASESATSDASEDTPSTKTTAPQATRSGDVVEAALLLNHVNANQLFYDAQVWAGMDSRERRLRLTPAAGIWADGISDQVIGVIGNHVALRYSGPLDLPGVAQLSGIELNELPSESTVVTLPTRGVFAEAHLGHCNGAEQRDITRMWNFSELPVSLLPNIEDLRAGPRGQAPKVEQNNLPATILNIQASPQVPNPQGVGTVITGLGNGSTFRDMSGLAQVSTMLDKLIASAQPPATDLVNAKSKVDELLKLSAPPLVQAPRSRPNEWLPYPTPTAEQGNGVSLLDNLSKYQLADIPSFVHDMDSLGGIERVLPTIDPPQRTPSTSATKNNEVQVVFVLRDYRDQSLDADLRVVATDATFGRKVFKTFVRRLSFNDDRPVSLSGLGQLPATSLSKGSIEVELTLEVIAEDEQSSVIVRGLVPVASYNFAPGTKFAVLEIKQRSRTVTVEVAEGKTLSETHSFGSKFAIAAKVTKVIELGPNGSVERNWSDVQGLTSNVKRSFQITEGLDSFDIQQKSP